MYIHVLNNNFRICNRMLKFLTIEENFMVHYKLYKLYVCINCLNLK